MNHYLATAIAINAALDTNPNTLLLDPFNAGYADVNAVGVRRSVYTPPTHSYPWFSGGPHPYAGLDQNPIGYYCRWKRSLLSHPRRLSPRLTRTQGCQPKVNPVNAVPYSPPRLCKNFSCTDISCSSKTSLGSTRR